MSKIAASIRHGLQKAVAYAKGDAEKKVSRPRTRTDRREGDPDEPWHDAR